mmetsp:Transcript_27907/g.26753  ORF Transcript_27907/g.26753 Transcript_27907/m.26753 type:complete len:375 (-) Transcript_27907:213-1337(-)
MEKRKYRTILPSFNCYLFFLPLIRIIAAFLARSFFVKGFVLSLLFLSLIGLRDCGDVVLLTSLVFLGCLESFFFVSSFSFSVLLNDDDVSLLSLSIFLDSLVSLLFVFSFFFFFFFLDDTSVSLLSSLFVSSLFFLFLLDDDDDLSLLSSSVFLDSLESFFFVFSFFFFFFLLDDTSVSLLSSLFDSSFSFLLGDDDDDVSLFSSLIFLAFLESLLFVSSFSFAFLLDDVDVFDEEMDEFGLLFFVLSLLLSLILLFNGDFVLVLLSLFVSLILSLSLLSLLIVLWRLANVSCRLRTISNKSTLDLVGRTFIFLPVPCHLVLFNFSASSKEDSSSRSTNATPLNLGSLVLFVLSYTSRTAVTRQPCLRNTFLTD